MLPGGPEQDADPIGSGQGPADCPPLPEPMDHPGHSEERADALGRRVFGGRTWRTWPCPRRAAQADHLLVSIAGGSISPAEPDREFAQWPVKGPLA